MTPAQAIIALLVAGALFLCPGYALIVILRPRWDFGIVETLCAATGLSIAVVPLVLYLATWLGVRLTPGRVILFLITSAGLCLWDWWRRFRNWRKQGAWQIDAVYLLLGIIFALTLFSRLWMVRGVDYPLWTDSYHHTVISQLIADMGVVPSSYEPYAPIERFTYHFGFHTLSAWYHWLSGSTVPRSVVVVGQVINALVVPTAYLFAYRLCRSRIAGLVAALLGGLGSHMPTLFVNWGRYPQLSGQILLAALIPVTMEALDPNKGRLNLWLLAGMGAAGLFLVHIRVFLFYGLFVILWCLVQCIAAWHRRRPSQARRLFLGSAVVGIVALLLLSPWLVRFFEGFGSTVARELASGYQIDRDASYFRWRTQDLIEFGMPLGLWLLAAAGGMVAVLKRNANLLLLIGWWAVLFAAANTHVMGMTPLFSNLVLSISLYLPAGTLIGYLASELTSLAVRIGHGRRHLLPVMRWGTIIACVVISVAGVRYATGLIRAENAFVRSADLDAVQWIQQNVSEEALFHIRTHFWTPLVAHGLDAGYWLPYLAQREVTVPLEPYASDGSPDYMAFVNRRARDLVEADTPEQLWQTMTNYDVTHVYLGNRPANRRADFFLGDPAHFRLLHSENGVWIFEAVH